MWNRFSFAASFLALGLSLPVYAASEREMTGRVTDSGSPGSFSLDGKAVECVPGTTLTYVSTVHGTLHGERECRQRSLGESITVLGTADKAGVIRASSITLLQNHQATVKGVAIIESVLPVPKQAVSALLADGYELILDRKSTTQFTGGMSAALSEVRPDTWIAYMGMLQQDGTVLVKTAAFRTNALEKGEDKLRKKSEFDAAAVAEEKRQGGVSRFFNGLDYTRIPAHRDAALQQRIDRIGQSLVPKYQHDLPTDDPMRLNLRFQLVDDKKLQTTGLASGIVLVPYREIAPLQSDAQVAALLGTGISHALAKHELAWAKLRVKENVAGVASAAADFFTFGGAGLVTALAAGSHERTVARLQTEHDLREALRWMHDAGYDLREAPKTWWLIDAEGRPLSKQPLPLESAYVYDLLDTTWKATLSAAGASAPTAQ